MIRTLAIGATLGAGLIGIAFLWHVADRALAVDKALDGYVHIAELAAAQSEIKVLTERLKIADEANVVFDTANQNALRDSAAFEMELENYETQTLGNDTCVVSDELFDLLH